MIHVVQVGLCCYQMSSAQCACQRIVIDIIRMLQVPQLPYRNLLLEIPIIQRSDLRSK